MAFPTGTFYDAYQDAINWLLNALGNAQKYPLLNAHALPRLHKFLQGLNEEWVEKRARNHEIPTLVLSVTRWLRVNRAPDRLLGMLEAGLHFNRNNRVELGNLTGNFWDPQKSQAILLQLMVTAYLIDRAPFEMLEPVTGPRPDLWLSIDGRRVGLEITSRNIRNDVRDGINRQDLPSSSRDLYAAREDFEALWRDTISHKLEAYDGADPIVLLVWDHDFLGDVHLFLTSPLDPSSPHSFRDLLELHRKDCSPLSAFLFLPYDGQPELATCDDLGRGQPLTPRERDVLRRLFVGNPVVESGLWPPQS